MLDLEDITKYRYLSTSGKTTATTLVLTVSMTTRTSVLEGLEVAVNTSDKVTCTNLDSDGSVNLITNASSLIG